MAGGAAFLRPLRRVLRLRGVRAVARFRAERPRLFLAALFALPFFVATALWARPQRLGPGAAGARVHFLSAAEHRVAAAQTPKTPGTAGFLAGKDGVAGRLAAASAAPGASGGGTEVGGLPRPPAAAEAPLGGAAEARIGDAGSDSSPSSPVLLGVDYLPTPGLREWQLAELRDVNRKYVRVDSEHMHGRFDLSSLPFAAEYYTLPLDRSIPETRERDCLSPRVKHGWRDLPPASVILIFNNEFLDMLMRSVHSILNRTPPHLLREILLVDDASDVPDLTPVDKGGHGFLQSHVALLPEKVRYLRLSERGGIPVARTFGIRSAVADIYVILDSHIEVQHGWLEPLLAGLKENPRAAVMPMIDGIDPSTKEPLNGGIGCHLGIIWRMIEHSYSEVPAEYKRLKYADLRRSPTMAGGLFAGNKHFFLDVGAYDEGMARWGAENLEFSFRLWQCGGELLCSQCSRVHHQFGGKKRWRGAPRTNPELNKLRTMAVWMDEFAELPYEVLGRPPLDAAVFAGLEDRKALRRRLRCRDYNWFIQNVWPESNVHDPGRDVPRMGHVRHVATGRCLSRYATADNACSTKFMYFARTGRILTVGNDEHGLTRNPRAKSGENEFHISFVDARGTDRWVVEEAGEDASGGGAASGDAAFGAAATGAAGGFVQLRLEGTGKCLSVSAADRSPAYDSSGARRWLDLVPCGGAGAGDGALWAWPRWRPGAFEAALAAAA